MKRIILYDVLRKDANGWLLTDLLRIVSEYALSEWSGCHLSSMDRNDRPEKLKIVDWRGEKLVSILQSPLNAVRWNMRFISLDTFCHATNSTSKHSGAVGVESETTSGVLKEFVLPAPVRAAVDIATQPNSFDGQAVFEFISTPNMSEIWMAEYDVDADRTTRIRRWNFDSGLELVAFPWHHSRRVHQLLFVPPSHVWCRNEYCDAEDYPVTEETNDWRGFDSHLCHLSDCALKRGFEYNYDIFVVDLSAEFVEHIKVPVSQCEMLLEGNRYVWSIDLHGHAICFDTVTFKPDSSTRFCSLNLDSSPNWEIYVSSCVIVANELWAIVVEEQQTSLCTLRTYSLGDGKFLDRTVIAKFNGTHFASFNASIIKDRVCIADASNSQIHLIR